MSKFYADRDSTSLEVLKAFEKSVKRLAFQFQGDDAFNFYHEHEIAACLMAWTRESLAASPRVLDSTICLARLEWPCATRRPIDLVLWAPSKAKEARDNWDRPRGELAKELPLLAAVQIKCGGGKVVPWTFTEKDIRDLEDVYESKDLQKPILYFLEYIDDDLRENKTSKRNRYRQVKSYLKKWCSHSPQYRRAMLFSRDIVGFAYPRRGWLIAPLPPRTKEEI